MHGVLWRTCSNNALKKTLADGYMSIQFIASKTKAALDGGLGVILCVGETLEVTTPSRENEI